MIGVECFGREDVRINEISLFDGFRNNPDFYRDNFLDYYLVH